MEAGDFTVIHDGINAKNRRILLNDFSHFLHICDDRVLLCIAQAAGRSKSCLFIKHAGMVGIGGYPPCDSREELFYGACYTGKIMEFRVSDRYDNTGIKGIFIKGDGRFSSR